MGRGKRQTRAGSATLAAPRRQQTLTALSNSDGRERLAPKGLQKLTALEALQALPGPVLVRVSAVEIEAVARVRSTLAACDDLRREPWAGSDNPVAGHCYIACEVLYHLWGGKEAGWVPKGAKHEGGPHWWLENKDGRRVDPTADQFATPVPYETGRGQGFLTKQPSKRAAELALRADIAL